MANEATIRASGNLVIDSVILGSDYQGWEHIFVTDDAVPSCYIEGKKIYSPSFGNNINEHEDRLVRGKCGHEALHARLTPHGKKAEWGKLKGHLVNMLEDLRIEKACNIISPVIAGDIKYLNGVCFGDIQKTMVENQAVGKMPEPIAEALIAMHAMENGFMPQWTVSEEAQKYIDASYDIIKEWRDVDNICDKKCFEGIEKIADRAWDALNKVKQDEKERQNQQENQKQEDGGQQEQHQNNTGGKKNNNKKKEKNEKQDRQSPADDNDGDDENDAKNQLEKNDGGGEKNQPEENNASDDDENGEGAEADDANDNQPNDDGNVDGNNDEEEDEDECEDEDENEQNSENEQLAKEQAEKELDDEVGNEDLNENAIRERLTKILENSRSITKGYTSFTGNDTILRAEENKEKYIEASKKIAGIIGQLSAYTENLLKAQSRCRVQRGLERGRVDKRKLVSISKSLSDKVFYKTTNGIDLNVAVTVMIDESGSIRHFCQQLRALAIAFSEVFYRLKIKFEVIGYTTGYENDHMPPPGIVRTIPIKIYEHKSYDEDYVRERYRLGSISSMNNNVDGESLIIAYKRIMQQRTNRRIIFVLSDGLPNAACDQKNLVCQNLYDSIQYVRNNGVEVYAFGVGTKEPEKFYGKENFVEISDVSKLGSTFFAQFRNILQK